MPEMTKITNGYVKQIFDEDGQCLRQEFYSCDEVEYEHEDDENFDYMNADLSKYYYPFDMVQPKESIIEKIKNLFRRK